MLVGGLGFRVSVCAFAVYRSLSWIASHEFVQSLDTRQTTPIDAGM